MTTHMQSEALRALAEVWALSPDVRLGQLMANLGFLGEDQFDKGLGYIENDELMAVLYRHKADLLARAPDASRQVLTSPSVPSATDSSTLIQPTG
jgi:hypothetical protein